MSASTSQHDTTAGNRTGSATVDRRHGPRTGRLPFVLRAAVGLVALAAVMAPAALQAQIEFEREPILYSKAPARDAVSALQRKLATGAVELEYDEKHGYLPSLLELLDVPASSQVLVNSKTSFQLRRISPRNPRALYFNDETYVGWVQGGDVIEVMGTDPQLGEVFYTLPQLSGVGFF